MTNITLPRAVVEQALEALEEAHTIVEHRQDTRKRKQAITAIRAALEASKEVEPVAWRTIYDGSEGTCSYEYNEMRNGEPLYTHPAPAVPEGWQLVPKEPTDEMLSAVADDKLHGDAAWCRTIYKGMLDAAPKPEG